MITAIKTENDITVCKVPPGTYKIDGKLVTIDGYSAQEVCIKNPENIIRVTSNKIISHYQDCDGNELSVFDYLRKKKELSSKGVQFDDDLEFEDLDDEYNYKKFLRTWVSVHKEVYNESGPIPVSISPVKLETGNPFIKSMFCLDAEKDSVVYVYNRRGATMTIVRECFESLGMEFKENLNYASSDKKKVWGNSSHSHLRYVVAFGTYIFDDSWQYVTDRRGNLETLLKDYEADKKFLEDHIKFRYNLHFGDKELSKVYASDLYNELKKIQGILVGIDVKQKSSYEKNSAVNCMNSLIEKLKQEVLSK